MQFRNSTVIYTPPASFETLLYNLFVRTTQKTQLLSSCEGVLIDPLPSNKGSLVASVRFCENVFTESLPSNGSTRCNIFFDISGE
jgi:hypothetical protein